MREFAVRAETHEGKTVTLRRHFPSRSAAEAHPVKLARWKRVWVEQVDKASEPPTGPPRTPWNILWIGGRTYVIDADNRKIATLLGSQEQREFVAGLLCDAFGAKAEELAA